MGYYIRPTIFTDVTNDMEIARTEIFGPVMCVIPFETEDEVVTMANDTPYGLKNYVSTADRERDVSRSIGARTVRDPLLEAINKVGMAVREVCMDCRTSWKQSTSRVSGTRWSERAVR